MKENFDRVINYIQSQLQGADESFTVYYQGESTDFARLNHNLVRQAGNVDQHGLRIQLIRKEKRHAQASLTLSNDWDRDRLLLTRTLEKLRTRLDALPDDPFLVVKKEVESTEDYRVEPLVASTDMIDDIRYLADGLDLVGILASGRIYRGFANSYGQNNWFECSSVHFDWSVYDQADKAIKGSFAGSQWERQRVEAYMLASRQRLPLLKRKSRQLSPGAYRVYLSPAAMEEVWTLLSWSSFGLNAFESKNSSLQSLYEGRAKLSDKVNLVEDGVGGVSPRFNESGFLRPAHVPLIAEGKFAGALISPRSAQEFGRPGNGAAASECPVALSQSGGNLQEDTLLKTLDRGLFISNLWYLNFSDHDNCRMTGMTRFATFWVENGELQEPLDVMRFDESLYRMLGENLVDLSQEPTLLVSASTYHRRSTESLRLPGALIDDFRLTL